MLGKHLLCRVEEALRVGARRDARFGGLDLMFLGDFLQLEPVRDVALYRTQGLQECYELDDIWGSTIKEVMVLEKVYRTQDPAWYPTLQRIRSCSVCPKDIDVLVKQIVQPRSIALSVNTRVVVRSCDLQDELNWEYVTQWALKTGQRVIIVPAQDILVSKNKQAQKQWNEPRATNYLRGLPHNKTSYLAGWLLLTIGMPCLVKHNIPAEKVYGLTNGAMGEVVRIWLSERDLESWQDDPKLPPFVCTELPYVEAAMGTYCKELTPFGTTTLIRPYQSDPYEVAFRSGKRRFRRTQLPIIPGFTFLAYGLQGLTLQNLVVDLRTTPRNTTRQYEYVALSRIKTLDSLHILREFDASLLYKLELTPDLKLELFRQQHQMYETSQVWEKELGMQWDEEFKPQQVDKHSWYVGVITVKQQWFDQ